MSEEHPILDMLGLGNEWSARTDIAPCCSNVKTPEGVALECPGLSLGLLFTIDGFCAVHSRFLDNPIDSAQLTVLLEAVGIELLECLPNELPCGRGGTHQFWTWKRKEEQP